MTYPTNLKYTKDHEWIELAGEQGKVGITDYAQQQLGDVVFVELPEVGTAVTRGQPFGVIESVKAVSDLYAPLSGEVLEVNGALVTRPELVNQDCYGEGWMLVVRPIGDATAGLLDPGAYAELVKQRS